MDAEELELEDQRLDALLCALGMMHLPNPLRAFRQQGRVLRPGGRAVAVVWGERARSGWAELLLIVERCVRSDVCPLFFQLGTGATLARVLERAGFEGMRLERVATTFARRA